MHLPSIDAASDARANPTGAVVVPISLATTFQQTDPGVPRAADDPNSFGAGYEYARTGNPTRGALERAVAHAEQGRFCVAFSSGSAATSAVLHCLQQGAHVVCVDDVYGGTQRYFRRIAQPTMGMRMEFVDMATEAKVDSLPLEENTQLVWLETPTNPTLKITDIALVARRIQQHNGTTGQRKCILAVDNTFCSPYFQTPLALGADLVVHSATKYIGGHSDVVLGLVCTNSESLYQQLRFVQNGIGAVPSPFDCFLAHRGLKTLHVRMQAASRNALAVAMYLEQDGVANGTVTKVLYPGLPSHPQYSLAQKQQHGPGAMITFYIRGGRKEAHKFLTSVRMLSLLR